MSPPPPPLCGVGVKLGVSDGHPCHRVVFGDGQGDNEGSSRSQKLYFGSSPLSFSVAGGRIHFL